jgi:hypothetical protein
MVERKIITRNNSILRVLLKTLFSRHCKRSEAIQNIDTQWIASGYHPRNDVGGEFLEVPLTRKNNKNTHQHVINLRMLLSKIR